MDSHEQYLLMIIEKMLPSVQQDYQLLDYHHFRYGWSDSQVDERLEELKAIIKSADELLNPIQEQDV